MRICGGRAAEGVKRFRAGADRGIAMDNHTLFDGVSQFFTANKEMLTILVAAIGGGTALFRFWRDRSWDKKQFAYDYAEKVFDDPRTMTALRMLDWGGGEIPADLALQFGLADAQRRWTSAEVCEALRVHDDPASKPGFSQKEYVIRELFDACLARFERLGHFMKSGVISATDFPTTLAYYPQITAEGRLKDLWGPLERYMKRYKFDHACELFRQLRQIALEDGSATGHVSTMKRADSEPATDARTE